MQLTDQQKRSLSPIDAKERLIVALDLPSIEAAEGMVRKLKGVTSFFKIGLTLQLTASLDRFVKPMIEAGNRVFLDYKYYDVAETIRKAVAQAASTGATFLTVHGNRRIIEAAVSGRGESDLKILAVTVLTSLDASDIEEMGFSCDVETLVLHRVQKSLEAGCDGVIASGREACQIRALAGNNLLIVAPAIRPEGYGTDDQKRTATPREAISAGADYLVVGRPITEQSDPRQAAERILEEMQAAFDDWRASQPPLN